MVPTAHPCLIFSYLIILKIEKPGVGRRESVTARGGQMLPPPPVTLKVRHCMNPDQSLPSVMFTSFTMDDDVIAQLHLYDRDLY